MKTAFTCFAAVLLATAALPAHSDPTPEQRTQLENCKIMSGAVFQFAKARDRKQSKMDAFKDVTHGQPYVPGSLLDETLQWAYAHPEEQPDTASGHFYGRCVLDTYDARSPDTEGELDVAALGCQKGHAGTPDAVRDCIEDKTQDIVTRTQTALAAAATTAPAAATAVAVMPVLTATTVVAQATPAPAPAPPPVQVTPAPVTAVSVPVAKPVLETTASAAGPQAVASAPELPAATPAASARVAPAPQVLPAGPAISAPEPVVAMAPAPVATPQAVTPISAPPLPAAAPTPVAVQAPATKVVVAQAAPPPVAPAAAPTPPVLPPAPVAVKAAAPMPVVAKAVVPQSAPPAAATLPPLPAAATMAGPPPSLVGFGKLTLGMSMDDAYKAMGSHGDTDWDQQGEVHTYMIGDDHGFIEIRPSSTGTLYSIRVVGGTDAHIAPILNVVLGDGAFVLINNVGMPSSRTPLPGDKELWNYLGRNYAFEISPGGDVIGLRITDTNYAPGAATSGAAQ